MKKNIWVASTFILLVVLAVVVFLASAQTASPEVVAVYLYNAQPLGAANTCMAGAPSPCLDGDGGYAPQTPSQVAASVQLMGLSGPVNGSSSSWFPVQPYQCVQATEICDSVTGNLFELVCGSSVGISSSAAFNAAFPGNNWVNAGEPVALFVVNCAGYAAAHPGQGLTGVCQTAPGTSSGYCA